MNKRILVVLTAACIIAGFAIAQQASTSSDNKLKVQRTAANDGKAMYTGYCAPCHGADGRSGGPVAVNLKQAPTDLTVLAKNNNGKFPETHLVAVMDFGPELKGSTHGTAEMPVWGGIFSNMDHGNSADKQLRISNLIRYIETLQSK